MVQKRSGRHKEMHTQKNSSLVLSEPQGFVHPADSIGAVTTALRPEQCRTIYLSILVVTIIGQCFIIQGRNSTGVEEEDFMQIFRFLLVGIQIYLHISPAQKARWSSLLGSSSLGELCLLTAGETS